MMEFPVRYPGIIFPSFSIIDVTTVSVQSAFIPMQESRQVFTKQAKVCFSGAMGYIVQSLIHVRQW